jgi:hypothetical protein
VIFALWGIEPWLEPGRSYPSKQGCYARQLLDFRGIPAATRNLSERLTNRFVKSLHPAGERDGYKLDGLKGTTTWCDPNPNYDPVYAAQICPSAAAGVADVAEAIGGETQWLRPYEARRLLRALGHSPEEASQIVELMPRSWEAMTEQEAYERAKRFYGLESGRHDRTRRIRYDVRLEPVVRHYGLLVTAPLYGRPHDLPAFARFMNGPRLTWAKWIAVLPRQQVSLLREHRDATKAGDKVEAMRIAKETLRAGRTSKTAVIQGPGSVPSDNHKSTSHGLDVDPGPAATPAALVPHVRGCPDHETASDETAAPIQRWLAMLRICLRRTHGKMEPAAQMTCRWWRNVGATGDSEAEEAERLERFLRLAAYPAQTFDEAKNQPRGEFRMTRDRAVEMAPDMDRLVPQAMRTQAAADHPHAEPLTSLRIAGVYGVFLRAVSTVAKGWGDEALCDVPSTDIKAMLRKLHMSMNPSTIAAITNLLIQVQLIHRVRRHFRPPGGRSRGRCAAYVINLGLYCPAWAEGHIPESSQLPAALHPSSSSLDNYELDSASCRDMVVEEQNRPVQELSQQRVSCGEYLRPENELQERKAA